MFSTDRDLLAIDPNLFQDIPMASQERLAVDDGVLSGTTLTSSSADFNEAQVAMGSVVLVAGIPHEVIEQVDAHTLTVSLIRATTDAPAIPSNDGVDLPVIVRSYAPQAERVHDELIRLLGIAPNTPAEAAIVTKPLMAELESFGTLERIYSGAAAVVGDNKELRIKAKEFGQRFQAACRSATILFDIDGDGLVDAKRSLGAVCLNRV